MINLSARKTMALVLGLFVSSLMVLSSPAQSYAANCRAGTFGNGNAGTCVTYIQRMLNGISYYYGGDTNATGDVMTSSQLSTDGIFGSLTVGKTKTFQRWTDHLTADGIVGPFTWDWLCMYAYNGPFSHSSSAVLRSAYYAASSAGCTGARTTE